MPSSWELEVESCSTVARGLDRVESCSGADAIVKIGLSEAVVGMMCQEIRVTDLSDLEYGIF